RAGLRNNLPRPLFGLRGLRGGRGILAGEIALFYWCYRGLIREYVVFVKKGSCGFCFRGLDTASPKRNGRRNEANGSASGRKRGPETGRDGRSGRPDRTEILDTRLQEAPSDW